MRKTKRIFGKLFSLLSLSAIIFFAFSLSSEAAEYVKRGMKLSIERVIPTAFPFMILTEAYTAYAKPEELKVLSFLFTRLFGINESGLRPFLCGNIAGFPLGTRIAASMYENGEIEKGMTERLLALSSNPSLPFMLGAVGGGMYGSIKTGAYLALSVYLSTLICGIIFKGKKKSVKKRYDRGGTPFSLTKSITRAGESCIGISSFITFFSVLSGIVSARISSPLISTALCSVLEVTTGVYSASALYSSYPLISLSISAFALGFGGLSVLMQSAYFKRKTDLGMSKYLIMKLTQGLLSSGIAIIAFSIT